MSLPAELCQRLRAARHLCVLTGAGISAESGVPTFRDHQTGFWSRYRPEDLATVDGFRRDPKLVSDWYAERRRLCAAVEPNPGHRALVELERRLPRFTLITQNIDGLHQRAGSRAPIELHGSLLRLRRLSDDRVVTAWDETESPPRCPETGVLLRPDVVWFGEPLPAAPMAAATAAAGDCDLFFCIGTSALVYPAAGLPLTASAAGATVVELNPEPTPITHLAAFTLRGKAGELLPALLTATWP